MIKWSICWRQWQQERGRRQQNYNDQNDIKDDDEDFGTRDLAKALNREILGLVAHGCRHIQVGARGCLVKHKDLTRGKLQTNMEEKTNKC